MATISIADVVRRASELKAFSETPEGAAAMEQAIRDAEATVDPDTWGARYDRGLALYAAHLVLSDNPGLGGTANAGPVVNEKLGDYSVSFAAPASGGTALGPHSNTRPGALYDAEITSLSPGFIYF